MDRKEQLERKPGEEKGRKRGETGHRSARNKAA
jgi:hypothetical protein